MVNMEHKLCMVTGANSGIGRVTARKLADAGAYVIMLCRNEEKARRVRKEIVGETGNTGVEIIIADLSLQYDIRRAAERFNSKFDQLDVLVNNAGTITSKRVETPDGIEKTFAVNHLGPFLLTNLLLDPLQTAPAARVVNVSSESHRMGANAFDLDNLQLTEGFTPMKAYGISKLCNIMFTHELAKRTENTSITTNALHPGIVSSGIVSEASWTMKILFMIGRPFMRSKAKGAETSIYLATSPEVEDISGKYFKNKKITTPVAPAYDDEITEELWEISEKLSGLA